IIGKHFFPARDVVGATLNAYGAFAAGFLMRPIGGLLFGHIGDRASRRLALMLSVLAMAVPTFLIGVLPDYAQIGVTASVLMVLMRMIQGVSVGGEYTTSVVFLVEGAAARPRGFAGSWGVFGAGARDSLRSAGAGGGGGAGGGRRREGLRGGGWRVPFLLGPAGGRRGLWGKRHLQPAPRAARPPVSATSPIREAFRSEWRAILRVAGFNVLNAV